MIYSQHKKCVTQIMVLYRKIILIDNYHDFFRVYEGRSIRAYEEGKEYKRDRRVRV